MKWKALILVGLLFTVASFVATINGSTPDARIAGALGVLPAVFLICTASIVRALTDVRGSTHGRKK